MATKLDAQVDELRQRYNLDPEGINSILDPLLEQYRNSFTIDLLEKQLRFMESTGQLVTKTTKEAETTEEVDTNSNEVHTDSEELRKVPLPAHNDILGDKKFKYNTFASLMACSNKNIGDVKVMEFTNYLYDNKIGDVLDFIYDTTGKRISERTFNSHMKNIIDSGYDLVDLQNTPNGLAYLLRAEYDGGYFVTIPFIQLKELLLSTNKNALKIYIFLKDYLKGKKQGEFTPIDRAFIARSIGLSDKADKNVKAIGTIVKSLAKLGFIDIKETVKKEVSKQDPSKKQVKTIYAYRVCTLEEYLAKDSKVIKK